MIAENEDRPKRSKAKPLPPIEYLRELFAVDPTSPSGLRWKVSRGKAKTGHPAGARSVNRKQENRLDWRVKVDSSNFKVARIIYLMIYGEIPQDLEIDHINGNPLDNRAQNLRLATRTENNRNRRLGVKNKSEVRGVCWHFTAKKWRAQICCNKKIVHLGVFANLDDARRAREEAELRLHGEFSPLARKEGA
jgi:hypothetical protein